MNLIPKSLSKQKRILYKSITLYDLIVFVSYIAFAICLSFPLVFLEWPIRIVIAASILLPLLITFVNVRNYDARFYQVIWYFIKYLVSNKNYYNSQTSILNPYDKIENELIKTKKSPEKPAYYLKIIKVRGFDITTLDEADANIKLDHFHSFIMSQKSAFSIVKLNEKFFYNFNVKRLEELKLKNKEDYNFARISEEEYKQKNSQIDVQIQAFEDPSKLLKTDTLAKTFYVVFYGMEIEKMEATFHDSINILESVGLNISVLDDYESINFVKNIYNPLSEDVSKETFNECASELDKLFNFKHVKFEKEIIKINEELLMSIQSVSDYPIELRNYWWSLFVLNEEANVVLNINPISQGQAAQLINKAIVNSATNQYNEKKQLQKMSYDHVHQGFINLAEQISKNEQKVCSVNVLFLNYDVDSKSLLKQKRNLEKHLIAKNLKVNRLKFRQFEAISSFLPKPNDPLIKDLGREIPTRSLANGYGLVANNLTDKNGLMIGTNWLDDPIIFDQFVLDPNRKNHNVMILGSSGSGKSFFTKKLINWNVINNKKVFILDPEREYQNITNHYDGNWIDVGSGTGASINPLQILYYANTENKILISNHILMLETFFQIVFPQIEINQLRYLTLALNDFYYHLDFPKKNIAKLTNDQFPIFDDFYNFIIKNKAHHKNAGAYSKEDVNYIREMIRSELISGSKLAFLYNNKTNLNFEKNLVCFDINSLFERSNVRITQAQLFLILNLIQKEVNENTYEDESIVIVLDEAHLLIDQDNPVALDFVFQMVKRIRKRNGGIIFITQNPDDFLANESIAKKTKAILNNTQYSFFFNLSPNNVKDVAKMYSSYGNGLTEDEKLYIAKARRGQSLFFVSGFDRHKINICVSDEEKQVF